MHGRNGQPPEPLWRRYLPRRRLHLTHVPAKVCCFCHARTHFPSRDRWWYNESPAVSCCPSCYRFLKAVPVLDPVMPHGLPLRPRWCPKCEALLYQEPAYSRCRWGCGKLWPIRGASLVRQFEFELRSGLLQIA